MAEIIGRITLHNTDTPNQIKVWTIKARVRATAVSRLFKCLLHPPRPSESVTLHFHLLLHEPWTASRLDINPSKQSKQGSKAPVIILELRYLPTRLMGGQKRQDTTVVIIIYGTGVRPYQIVVMNDLL